MNNQKKQIHGPLTCPQCDAEVLTKHELAKANSPLKRLIHSTCGEVYGFTINPSEYAFERRSTKQICCMCLRELCESNTYIDRKHLKQCSVR